MKILIRILLHLILCTSLLSSCRKQAVDQLPPITHTGTNTFGCLINGGAWIPTGSGLGVNPTSGGFFKNPDLTVSIYIQASSVNDYIDIYLKNITQPGTYVLNQETNPFLVYPESYGAYFISGSSNYYATDNVHTGTVSITNADTITQIVSGTFEMNVFRKSTNEVINITEGRFDYKTH
jgi:hypothetical protein